MRPCQRRQGMVSAAAPVAAAAVAFVAPVDAEGERRWRESRDALRAGERRRREALGAIQAVHAELDRAWEGIGSEVSALLGQGENGRPLLLPSEKPAALVAPLQSSASHSRPLTWSPAAPSSASGGTVPSLARPLAAPTPGRREAGSPAAPSSASGGTMPSPARPPAAPNVGRRLSHPTIGATPRGQASSPSPAAPQPGARVGSALGTSGPGPPAAPLTVAAVAGQEAAVASGATPELAVVLERRRRLSEVGRARSGGDAVGSGQGLGGRPVLGIGERAPSRDHHIHGGQSIDRMAAPGFGKAPAWLASLDAAAAEDFAPGEASLRSENGCSSGIDNAVAAAAWAGKWEVMQADLDRTFDESHEELALMGPRLLYHTPTR